MMESPFKNDPLSMIYQAFKQLYPNKPCEIWWDPTLPDFGGGEYGVTLFPDDGKPPHVFLFSCYRIDQQTEILAHELAHVAVGPKHEHDEVWNVAFEAIFLEYNKIGHELFGESKNE